MRRSPLLSSQPVRRVPTNRVESDDGQALANGPVEKKPFVAPVLRDERHSGLDTGADTAASQPPSVHLDVADVARQAEDRTSHLGAARAHKSGQAEDLSLGDVERDA